MKKSRTFIALMGSVLLMTVGLVADAKVTRTGSPSVKFVASGPAGMNIVGTTSDLDVDDQGGKIVIRVPLKNLTTGLAMRDDHMRNKYLEVATYPNAELTVDRASLKMPNGPGSTSGDASGTMAIHGKTKATNFHYLVGRNSSGLLVGGTVHLDLRDYGISVPSYLGVTVKPELDVEVHFNASE